MKKYLRNTSRLLSIILAISLIISSLPIHVFAKKSSTEVRPEKESEPLIQGEVIAERDEYKKVYELQDGTFYEINSLVPMHYKENDVWNEIKIDAEIPNTIDEALDYCSELTQYSQPHSLHTLFNPAVETYGIDINESETTGTSSVIYRIIGRNIETATTYLNKSTCVVAQFANASLKNNINTQSTIECKFMFRSKCSKSVKVYAHQIISPIDLTQNNLSFNNIDSSKQILDYATIKNTSNYSFDITDLYIKWEKGLTDNNGIVLNTTAANNITVYSCFITRQYRIFDLYDADYSYHKISMGRAGTIYINDYTNTVMLSRNEFSLDSTVIPLNLTRYYDFGHTDASFNPFGDAGWWNYESCLKVVTSLNYKWQTPDGKSIYFIPNPDLNTNGTNKYWMDYKGEGYSLELDITKENLFENAIIRTPYNESYIFGISGKVIDITDETGNKITIKYTDDDLTQSNIIYIQDSLERRLYFNYGDITSNGKTYEVLKGITAKYKTPTGEYAIISIDGDNAIMTYNYTVKDAQKVLLSEVIYPDGQSVSYSYTNNMLTSITDIDGRSLNLNYNYEVSNNEFKNIYPCLASYREIIRDEEHNRDILLSSLNIDSHNSYQRKFTNELNQEELIQYNRNLRVIYYNSFENTFFADYTRNPNGYEYMSQILSPNDANNLVLDANFEGENDSWSFDQCEVVTSETIEGEKSLKISGAPDSAREATQEIMIDGKKGDIYVLGGYSKANTPIPTDKYYWGLEVHSYKSDEQGGTIDTLLFSTNFDSTIDDEPQLRMGAFVLPEDTDSVDIKLVFSHQDGCALFDNIIFYETTDEFVTLLQNPWISNDNDDDTSYEDTPIEGFNANGLKTYELYNNDNINLLKTYEYDSETLFCSAYTNENNIRVLTNYDNQTGVLLSESLGEMTKTYSYNAVGALKEVSRADAAIEGDTSKITAKYTYSNDKIKTIEHNGFVYTFTYNLYGSVQKVELNRVGNSQKDTLIEYDYSDDINQDLMKITYANGTEIISIKEMEDNGYSRLVRFKNSNGQLEDQYKYYFNNNDELIKCIDYQSSRIIEYAQNAFIVYDSDDVNSMNPALTEICKISTNVATGTKTINLFNKAYTITSHDGIYNDTNKTITYLSDYDFSFSDKSLSFTSTSILDFFGRKISSKIVFDDDAKTKSIMSSYSYKDFTGRKYSYCNETNKEVINQTINTSSTLVSKYQTDIISTNKKDGNNSIVSQSFISTYEYDEAGRVIEVKYGNDENDLHLINKESFYIGLCYLEEILKKEEAIIKTVIDNNATEKYKQCFDNKLVCEHLFNGLHRSFDNYFRNPRFDEKEYVANCNNKIISIENNIIRLKNKLEI